MNKEMTFYHGTTKEAWDEIQREGMLYGRRWIVGADGTKIEEVERCTYLAVDEEEAQCYGNVILQVEYNPFASKLNNYCDGCWQVRVYEPITLDKVKVLRYGTKQ